MCSSRTPFCTKQRTKNPLKIERFQRITSPVCVYLGSRVRACVYKCIHAVLRAQKNEECKNHIFPKERQTVSVHKYTRALLRA